MDIVSSITDLYKENNWKEIIHKYHDHPDRNKLLWVYPSEENFEFMKKCLNNLCCSRILSVGCGSGLLEWIITQATGKFIFISCMSFLKKTFCVKTMCGRKIYLCRLILHRINC